MVTSRATSYTTVAPTTVVFTSPEIITEPPSTATPKVTSTTAKLLNEVIETIQNPDEKISENRILLMASLILADKNITNNIDKNETNFNLISSKEVLVWLERINLKINKVASLLDES